LELGIWNFFGPESFRGWILEFKPLRGENPASCIFFLSSADLALMSPVPDPICRLSPCVRLREIGFYTLLIGFTLAAVIYFLGPVYHTESTDNPLLDGYYKKQSAAMQRQTGDLGNVMLTLRDYLGHADVEAAIVAVITILLAFTFFYLASRARQ
jgi:hypothetical protein